MLICLAQQNNVSAMEELLSLHMALIHSLASRICVLATLKEELIQAGTIGFIQAVHRYDTRSQVRLCTYAFPWILGEMRRFLRSEKNSSGTLSLDAQLGGEESQTLSETLGMETIDISRLDLRLALDHLENEERLLIYLRFFRDKTQKETAQLLARSQAQISRLERKALDHLHALLA